MSSQSEDPFTSLVETSFQKLDSTGREVLLALATLAPAPNTFSQDAALDLGRGTLAQLYQLCELGLLQQPATGRYSLPSAVQELLRKKQISPDVLRRVTQYFAQYAHTYEAQLSAIELEYENILRALDIARELNEYRDVLQIIVSLSRALELRGSYHAWRDLLSEAVNTASGTDDRNLKATALMHLARVELKTGNFEKAEYYAREVLKLEPDSLVRTDLLITLGHILLDRAHILEAQTYLEEALRLARGGNAPGTARQAAVILGTVLTRLGNYEDAASLTITAMEEAEQAGDLAVFASLATNLGVIRFHQGRYDEAIEVDDRGFTIAERIGFTEKQAALLQAKGGALVAKGNPEMALPLFDRALESAREIGHRWYVAIILKERGEALLKLERLDESIDQFRKSLTEAPADAKDVAGYAHWGLARCLLRQGQTAAAVQEGSESLRIFEEIKYHLAPEVRRWLIDLNSRNLSRD
jgi:tetratricopeptide (TPR) repeat protein